MAFMVRQHFHSKVEEDHSYKPAPQKSKNLPHQKSRRLRACADKTVAWLALAAQLPSSLEDWTERRRLGPPTTVSLLPGKGGRQALFAI